MKFVEAEAAAFEEGRKVRRTFWSKQVIVGVEDSILCIRGFSSSGPDDGKWHAWTIAESDYFADDWEVVE